MRELSFRHFSVNKESESLIDFYLVYQSALDYGVKQFNQELHSILDDTFLSLLMEEYDLYGESYCVTVALSGDVPVGFMTYTYQSSCHVSALWVNPSVRRKGIGKALIETLRHYRSPITLFVQKTAVPTQAFYTELSFKRITEFKRSYLFERASL